MLSEKNTILVVIDVQGKLAQLMQDKESLLSNLQKLIKGAQTLGIPILCLEQNPSRMGETVPEVRDLLVGQKALEKMSFSCCGDARFMQSLKTLGRQQVLLDGIETHVCVYQTAANLLPLGFEVEVVADAVSSRRAFDKDIGLERIRSVGARITCVEMALFELMCTAEHPAFKEILKIVR